MTEHFRTRLLALALSAISMIAVAHAQPANPAPPPPSEAKAFTLPDGYPSAEEIRQHLYQIAESNPDLCQAIDLTDHYSTPATHGGRHLYALRISAGAALDHHKPAVLFVAAHHGDEIATVVTALEGIDTLIRGYGSDSTISALLDTREVWIAPLWNPDGYTNGTRVNGRQNSNESIGVDLNRNYPFGFGECGGSEVPGNLTYQGPSAASEPETQTMIAFAKDKRFVIVHDAHAGALDLRTGYGCERVHPWREFMNLQASGMIETTQLNFAQGSSCCLAGNIHTHMAFCLSNTFLWELGNKKQAAEDARKQAQVVWTGIVPNLGQPISLSGRTIDASTGMPVHATITLPEAGFTMNESGSTRGDTARFDLILPPGVQTIEFSAEGYEIARVEFTIEPENTLTRTIQLVPINGVTETADPE